jgi:hypothetical protein
MNTLSAASKAKSPEPKRAIARSVNEQISASNAEPIMRSASCACGGGCARCNNKKNSSRGILQAKLQVGAPHDAYEQEADRVADEVLANPGGNPISSKTPPLIQRLASQTTGYKTTAPPSVERALSGSGRALNSELQQDMSQRFNQDFSEVRIHTGVAAAQSAQQINANAYTVGHNIVFGTGQFAPHSQQGKRLLAHELTHVVQQRNNKTSGPVIHRQTIGTGCAVHQAEIEAAWAEGSRLASDTITTLDNTMAAINYNIAPSSIVSTALQNSFGDIGLTPGFSFLPQLIRNYRSILAGFASGKTLRCDPESLGADRNECDWRAAFVVVGNSTDIFLCPSMFAADVSVTSRSLTLLHEMAHSVLRATHAGIPERTFPSAFFDCGISLGLEWEDAKRNAFAYDRLSDCLHGERPSSRLVTPVAPTTTTTAESSDSRWSISASAGADVTPNAYRFASALSTRVSLRTGEFVVFNPTIGFNLLYMPSSDLNASHLAAATADIGLRIQQPLDGFYFDIAAGAYAGFDIDPTRPDTTRFTGGPTASAGLGWRFQRLELGPEVRALIPEANFDHTQVLVFGRAAYRF